MYESAASNELMNHYENYDSVCPDSNSSAYLYVGGCASVKNRDKKIYLGTLIHPIYLAFFITGSISCGNTIPIEEIV